MCEFVSWIEYEGKNYFITEIDLQTKEGRKLLLQYDNNIYHEDIVGHGMIRAYYPELKNMGKNRECTDFSNPANFPPEIVEQIKAGNMKFMVVPALLNKSAWAEYVKINKPALAEYGKINKSALAEYEKIKEPAWAEYVKIARLTFWKLFCNKKNRAKKWQ